MSLFLAIDGNSLMHRAFHALPLLDDGKGQYTNAVFGFAGMLLRLLAERKPEYVAVAFDLHGPTFRHDQYEDYKAGRKPMAEELRPQFPLIHRILEDMGIRILEVERFEADDLLGAVAEACEAQGIPALLVTGDRDALQLVSDQTHVLYTKRGITDTVEFDPQTVLAQYGITPGQVPDLKGLMGDASDNIPGIPGIGEKTAVKLLSEFGSLDAVLDAAEQQKGKLRERLLEHRDLALLSRELATIRRDAPLPAALADCKAASPAGARPLFERLGFQSLLNRLDALSVAPAPEAPAAPEKQARSFLHLHSLAEVEALAANPPSLPLALHANPVLTLADETHQWEIPLALDLLSEGLPPDAAWNALAPLFQQPGSLLLYDAKAQLRPWENVDGDCVAGDVMLAAYLIDALSKPKSLEDLVQGTADAGALYDLHARQLEQLAGLGMTELYEQVELPLMRVLLSMERIGFLMDRQELVDIGARLRGQENALREEIYDLTGVKGFNILSPKQLGTVLFETLGLPSGRKTKSGFSTDADTLEDLADLHPAVEKILAYRQVTKLYGTYIEGLLSKIGSDRRVHSTFDQTAAVTGRISSNEPNLQNIPTRTAQGREIRRAFIAPEGRVLVDADYSQIELRVLAHMSGDPGMVAAFRNGEDIHTRTAAEVYEVALEAVTPAMRSAAKAVNFGIVYGISDFGLARNIGVTRAEAGAFIERYFARYPGVRHFMDDAVAKGKTLGYAATLMGRRRSLPELSASAHQRRMFGERAAMNTPVQGTAADIIKLAMVRVERALSGLQARLILQVHDELIVESPLDEAEHVAALLKAEMEQVVSLSVPLVVDAHIGPSWFEAK